MGGTEEEPLQLSKCYDADFKETKSSEMMPLQERRGNAGLPSAGLRRPPDTGLDGVRGGDLPFTSCVALSKSLLDPSCPLQTGGVRMLFR